MKSLTLDDLEKYYALWLANHAVLWVNGKS